MEDNASIDVEAVECIDSQDDDDPDGAEKRPIMLLLCRLIRNKQNTVMTNAQITDILQIEFNICIETSHDLEVDIYIKIVKKYLKDWPQWEELERISTKLNNVRDFEAVSKVLNHKYKNLKEYLGVMLEAAKPWAQEAVKNVAPVKTVNTANTTKTKTDDNVNTTSDVVMEIQCTKAQLDHLILRKPRSDRNNTVFNMETVAPSRISLKNITFKQLLYGWCVKVYITLPNFWFCRDCSFKVKHVLVNKAINEPVRNESNGLPTSLQVQSRDQVGRIIKRNNRINREAIINQFGDILEACAAQSSELYAIVHSLIDILLSELKDTFDENIQYKVPALYRRYANKYKYVRYLCAEADPISDSKYDLHLEETATPTYFYYIGKIEKLQKPICPVTDWLKIKCHFCDQYLPMISPNFRETLETHFNEVHQNEVDWQCTHCKRLFSIGFLMDNKWFHEC